MRDSERGKKTSQNKMKVDSAELSGDERKYDRRRGRKTGGEGGRETNKRYSGDE